MTADPFTEAARAETEALVDDIIRWDDTIATDGSCDGTWDSLAEYLAGRGWARTHLAAQEPTEAEVEASAEAWEAHTLAGFHEDEGEMCCRECGEAFDWVPLDGVRFNARRRSHRFRAALSAARAARRDEEKR